MPETQSHACLTKDAGVSDSACARAGRVPVSMTIAATGRKHCDREQTQIAKRHLEFLAVSLTHASRLAEPSDLDSLSALHLESMPRCSSKRRRSAMPSYFAGYTVTPSKL
jgi:hypothetical protein